MRRVAAGVPARLGAGATAAAAWGRREKAVAKPRRTKLTTRGRERKRPLAERRPPDGGRRNRATAGSEEGGKTEAARPLPFARGVTAGGQHRQSQRGIAALQCSVAERKCGKALLAGKPSHLRVFDFQRIAALKIAVAIEIEHEQPKNQLGWHIDFNLHRTKVSVAVNMDALTQRME